MRFGTTKELPTTISAKKRRMNFANDDNPSVLVKRFLAHPIEKGKIQKVQIPRVNQEARKYREVPRRSKVTLLLS